MRPSSSSSSRSSSLTLVPSDSQPHHRRRQQQLEQQPTEPLEPPNCGGRYLLSIPLTSPVLLRHSHISPIPSSSSHILRIIQSPETLIHLHPLANGNGRQLKTQIRSRAVEGASYSFPLDDAEKKGHQSQRREGRYLGKWRVTEKVPMALKGKLAFSQTSEATFWEIPPLSAATSATAADDEKGEHGGEGVGEGIDGAGIEIRVRTIPGGLVRLRTRSTLHWVPATSSTSAPSPTLSATSTLPPCSPSPAPLTPLSAAGESEKSSAAGSLGYWEIRDRTDFITPRRWFMCGWDAASMVTRTWAEARNSQVGELRRRVGEMEGKALVA